MSCKYCEDEDCHSCERKHIKPEVGMGVTHKIGSDAYSYTIVKVITPKKVLIARDIVIPYGPQAFTEQQENDHVKGTSGCTVITKRKNGHWYAQGDSMVHWQAYFLGFRRTYEDPHF